VAQLRISRVYQVITDWRKWWKLQCKR